MPVTINLTSAPKNKLHVAAIVTDGSGVVFFSARSEDVLMMNISAEFCAEWWGEVAGGEDCHGQTLPYTFDDACAFYANADELVHAYFHAHQSEWMELTSFDL